MHICIGEVLLWDIESRVQDAGGLKGDTASSPSPYTNPTRLLVLTLLALRLHTGYTRGNKDPSDNSDNTQLTILPNLTHAYHLGLLGLLGMRVNEGRWDLLQCKQHCETTCHNTHVCQPSYPSPSPRCGRTQPAIGMRVRGMS